MTLAFAQPPDPPRYDWLIVTASNDTQAQGYRQQLAARVPDDGTGCELPGCKRVLVVPDPHGKRAGSGGSTFAVLVELARAILALRPHARTLEDLFLDQQVLILHSGGDARRLPPYAARGKIFVPVPAISPVGEPLFLFDLVLRDFTSLPRPRRGRLIIGAGDLLLRLDRTRPLLEGSGVVGVSCDATPDRGTRHGVYVTDEAGKVTAFLQKPSLDALRDSQAISAAGTVKVDTGALSIDWFTICRWLDALGLRVHNGQITATGLIDQILAADAGPIDLYEHILCLLAPGHTAPLSPPIAETLADALANTLFNVVHLTHCDFLHIGTSRELLELGSQPIWGDSIATDRRISVLSSDLASSKFLGPAFVENAQSPARVKLDGQNLLIGLPRGAVSGSTLNGRECAVWIPIDDDKWTYIRYHIDLDWKARSISSVLSLFQNRGALESASQANPQKYFEAIMPAGIPDASAFHARMWMVGTISDIESMEARLKESRERSRHTACAAWLKSERISIAEITARANLARIQSQHARLTRLWLTTHAREALSACPLLPTSRILEVCRLEPDLRTHWIVAAKELAASTQGGFAVRCARIASVLQADSLEAQWNPPLRTALARCIPAPRSSRPALSGVPGVSVSLPARIDLAGGWTDTPPICIDSGGLVLNLAIRLSGRLPVTASVRSTSTPAVIIRSHDQNQHIELPLSEPLVLTDTGDWSSLARAALRLTFVSAADSSARPLSDYLRSGLEISFESAVPKGSGLGTSSILAAALVMALRCYQGHPSRNSELHEICRRVSTIEQSIGSCGGWQDQYGGLVPGLKSLATLPGLDQTPAITRFSLNSRIGELLRERTLLYYTGQQRLAANILQRFVGRYLDRDASTLRIIRGIQNTAHSVLDSLQRDDPGLFVRNVTRYWHHKRQIDSSASNAMIDDIIAAAAPDLGGYLLPGAGGGGFLLFFASSYDAKARIVERFKRMPPNPEARFYELELDDQGPQLVVT